MSVTSGNNVSAKFWPADGVTTEASAATTTWSYNTLSGFAGITGPSGILTSMDVYYMLIENSQLPSIVAGSEVSTVPSTTTMAIASGATWDINGTAQIVAGLTDVNPGNGGSIINSNTGAASILTLSPTGGPTTFSGTIQAADLGTISLVMSGSGTQVLAGSLLGPGSLTVNAGTLILSGTDTYTGGTTVSGGTLAVTTSNALPTGTTLTIGAGGTFIFDPTFTGSPVTGGAVSPRCRNRARWPCWRQGWFWPSASRGGDGKGSGIGRQSTDT